MRLLKYNWSVMVRGIKHILREPQMLMESLLSPIFWLYLFGYAFAKLEEAPGFPAPNYVTFTAAGVIGIFILDCCSLRPVDIVRERLSGYYRKMLVYPISRTMILTGSISVLLPKIIIPIFILLLVILLGGIKLATGLLGLVLILLLAFLCSFGFICIGFIFAMISREEGDFFGMANLFKIPVMFLTYTLFPKNYTPQWLDTVATYNPFTYLVVPVRSLIIDSQIDWSQILISVLVLTGFGGLMLLLSNWVFSIKNVEK